MLDSIDPQCEDGVKLDRETTGRYHQDNLQVTGCAKLEALRYTVIIEYLQVEK